MAVTALEHVLVLSDDIAASRDFYSDIVGLRAGRRPSLEFPGYWLYAGDSEDACLHIADRHSYLTHAAGLGLRPADASGTRTGSAAAGVDHIAFDADDYDEVERRITRSAHRAVRNQVPGGPRQLFIADPDGVLVEINVKDAR